MEWNEKEKKRKHLTLCDVCYTKLKKDETGDRNDFYKTYILFCSLYCRLQNILKEEKIVHNACM